MLRSIASMVLAVTQFVLPARAADLPAFPGAEGFGTTTPGGRGGQVLLVTQLGDAGPGSLRAALETPGPRTIVFRVGGTIEVDSPLAIVHPHVTIAGQSAPGGGITLKSSSRNLYAPLQVKTHDVVIRYLRSRPGMGAVPPPSQDGSNVDALTIADLDRDVYNVVIDHCSLSWSVDEVVNVWYDAHDVTVQWCILSEGLHNPPRRQGAGSKGPLLGGRGSDRIALHHSLLAHNVGRNPMIKATGLIDVVGNVIFVPGTVATVVDGELGPCHVNFVGNQVLAPRADGWVYGVAVLGPRPVSLFVEGNFGPYRTEAAQDEALVVAPRNAARDRIVPQRVAAPRVSLAGPAETYRAVLEAAGCTRPQRDAVDRRVVEDVRAGRTRVVVDPAEVGGWPALDAGVAPIDADRDGLPDDWERAHRLDPNDRADSQRDSDGDGYTNLEQWLNGAALGR